MRISDWSSDVCSSDLALASLAIGLKDWTKMTEAQFEEASDFLRRVHENVRVYWQDGAGLAQVMASGEVSVTWAWHETSVPMQADGHPVEIGRASCTARLCQ